MDLAGASVHPLVVAVLRGRAWPYAVPPQVVVIQSFVATLATPAVLRAVGVPPRIVVTQYQAVSGQMLRARVGGAPRVPVLPSRTALHRSLHLLVAPGVVRLPEVGFVDDSGAPVEGAFVAPAVGGDDLVEVLAELGKRDGVINGTGDA